MKDVQRTLIGALEGERKESSRTSLPFISPCQRYKRVLKIILDLRVGQIASSRKLSRNPPIVHGDMAVHLQVYIYKCTSTSVGCFSLDFVLFPQSL